LWFWWFSRCWPMKHTCILYCTHMWSKCIHSWDIGHCLVGFDLFCFNYFKVVKRETNFSKMIFKTKYLANLLGIVWYDYMKICEWFLGVEYDVYHSVVYFLPYLECEKSYVVIELRGEVDMVGEYIYVNWLWFCWWLHIC